MPKQLTDTALVLRSHNVGETDRFCILLTRSHGRITVSARGARRTLATRTRGLLPFHLVSVTWAEHSFGNTVTAAECLDAHRGAWNDPHAFSCAAQGVELLLKLTEDGLSMPDVHDLTHDFLRACDGPHPPTILFFYALKLLKLLGYLPAPADAPTGMGDVLSALDQSSLAALPPVSAATLADISFFLHGLVGSQLGISLKSPSVRSCISLGVTPTCQ